MNAQTQFKQIGETPEYQAPAIRVRLSDVLAEYEEKAASIPAVLAAFAACENDVKTASTVSGTYGSPAFSTSASLYQKDVEISLLRSAWNHIYDGLNIAQIASAKDRDQLKLMLTSPPPFTMDNIREIFADYLIDPRFHILKGLAECFCDLDPAYKSHSRVKIGVAGLPKRIIINSVTGWGSWGRKRLEDTLNALAVYRGRPRYEYAQFENMLKEAQRHGESDFDGGRVKAFQNGNAHLIFDKHGLLDINRALAEFYGEVLPDAPSEAEARRPSTEVTRDLQFYPTPRKVAQTVIDALHLSGGETILEPSCGDGQIMDILADWHRQPDTRRYRSTPAPLLVTGVEYDSGRAAQARAKGHHVMTANFLQVTPDPRFDVVILNPPFHGKTYRKHLDHAVRFLRPGGVLACIMPATAHYDHGNTIGKWHDLPVGSFAESGTNVPTGFCVYYAPK